MPKLFVSLCKLQLAANQKLLSLHSRRDLKEKLFQLEKPHTDGVRKQRNWEFYDATWKLNFKKLSYSHRKRVENLWIHSQMELLRHVSHKTMSNIDKVFHFGTNRKLIKNTFGMNFLLSSHYFALRCKNLFTAIS